MKKFIGTKEVKAELTTRGDYCKYRGWDVPSNEDPSDQVYLVEYPVEPGTVKNHPDHEGYISMNPKEVFEKYYFNSGNMSFGHAVYFAKSGLKVARVGWNGAGMYVVIMPGYPNGIEANENTRVSHNLPEGAILKFRPYFQLFTAQGDVAMWSPSGSDALADDWVVVD